MGTVNIFVTGVKEPVFKISMLEFRPGQDCSMSCSPLWISARAAGEKCL